MCILKLIRGSAKNGYVQTDLMFGDPDWMKWSLRGGEVGSEYKGSDRHVMIASIAKPQGYKWSPKQDFQIEKLMNLLQKIPNKIAELILGKGATANDLNSVETIHAKIKARSDYDQLVADVRDSFAKIGKSLSESAGPIKWFRNLLNKIKI